MKLHLFFLLFVFSALCFGQVQLEGLWLVEKVRVGEESVTPMGKWTRFNLDGTYTSGNGWKQHSIGRWIIEEQELSMEVSNSVADRFRAFRISQTDPDRMTWVREEDGMRVEVYLSRIQELPTTSADKILGVWEVQSNLQPSIFTQEGRVTIFLRWDNVCVINTPEEKIYGVYRIHGHKPELQWFPFNEEAKREVWTFEFDQGGELVLKTKDGPMVVLIRTSED